jgi:hypothetical protein
MKIQFSRFDTILPVGDVELADYIAKVLCSDRRDTLEMPAIGNDIAQTAVETVRPPCRRK